MDEFCVGQIVIVEKEKSEIIVLVTAVADQELDSERDFNRICRNRFWQLRDNIESVFGKVVLIFGENADGKNWGSCWSFRPTDNCRLPDDEEL
jgi:hypothetical protein